MIAMQYRFDFPRGSDMAPIHRRVAEKGPAFDGLAGLEYKAFLVADAALGQPERYAPFYLWRSATGMREFLLSDLFAAVRHAFGRPQVTTWTVLRQRSFDTTKPPRYATQQTSPIAVDAPSEWIRGEALAMATGHAGLYSSLVAFDPRDWRLTRLSLWHDRPPAASDVDLFHVPYLATR